MTVCCLFGDGPVAGEAARLLAARGEEVRVASGPPPSRRGILRGADRVLLVGPAGSVPRAARAARVRNVVWVGTDCCPEADTSGLALTRIRPNLLYQDDLPWRTSIVEQGLYPVPIGSRGVSRVDARDVAEAAVRALLEPGHEGRTYPLVGPEALTGQEVASYYAYALGRPVRYAGDDLDLWERLARQALPAELVDDLKSLYRRLQESGLCARCGDFSEQEKILSHPPRPFGMYARDIAREWAPGSR